MRTRGLALLVLGLSMAGWACAANPVATAGPAAVDPAHYQALHWRLIGPFRGGRVLTVAGIPGDSRHFYFGAVDGGVWSTQDAGRTWQPLFDSQPVGSIGAIAIAPSSPSTIYVGTGEADMRSDIVSIAGGDTITMRIAMTTDSIRESIGGRTATTCGSGTAAIGCRSTSARPCTSYLTSLSITCPRRRRATTGCAWITTLFSQR